MGCFSSKGTAGGAKDDKYKKNDKQEEGVDIKRNVAEGGFTNENFIFENKGRIQDAYQFDDKMLGQGTYGSVSKGVHKSTKAIRAIKSISKQSSQVKNLERFKQEIQIMKFVDHPNIIKLFETFEDVRSIYLVMELCSGGELFDRIIAAGHFTESQAAVIMKQVLMIIYYLHENGIMHRDLKPENFLLVSMHRDLKPENFLLYEANQPIEKSTVKIIDFGLSCSFKPGDKKKTKAGTPYYVSPEVLVGSYNEKCDVWSCGVIMYIMLCGYPPFYGDTDAEVIARVKKGSYSFVKADWKDISVDATDLIANMLKGFPEQRLSAKDALAHVWIKDKAPKAKMVSLGQNIVTHLRQFKQGSKLKKAALHVIATHMDDDQIKNLRALFMQLDNNGDGQLTIAEIMGGLEKAGVNEGAEEMRKVLENIDSDGSGTIDYTEFLAATLDKRQYLKEDVCWAAFQVFDRDGNGKISRQELADVLNNGDLESMFGKNMVAEILKDADTDGDGEIDFQEFMAMMAKDAGDHADTGIVSNAIRKKKSGASSTLTS